VTGYEKEKVKATPSGMGITDRPAETRAFERINDPQIPLTRHKFGLTRRYRLDRKLASAIGSSDLLNFEELSREMTATEAVLGFLRSQADEHEARMGHNPIDEPLETPAVSMPTHTLCSDDGSVTVGSAVPVVPATAEGALLKPGAPGKADGLFMGEDGFCKEKHRLVDELLQAIRELNALHAAQTDALIAGDSDFSRFDVLIELARQKKDNAKYAWMAHVEAHHCDKA